MSADELLLGTALGAWILAPLFLLALDQMADWMDRRDAERECRDVKRRKLH